MGVYFFVSYATLNGMQNDIKFNVESTQEIKCFENPHCIHHVTDDIVAMNSVSKFGLVDLKRKQVQYIPYENNRTRASGEVIIQSNDKKIVLTNGHEMMIYDRRSKDYQWFDCKKINSLKIDSHQDAFFCNMNGFIVKCDYTINRFFEIASSFSPILDIDNKNQTMYVLDYDGDVSLRSLHNLDEICGKMVLPKAGNRGLKKLLNHMYQVSPDKSCLAFGTSCCIYKIKQDKKDIEYTIESLNNEIFKHMAFLPTTNILATVSQSREKKPIKGKSIIRYWDFFQELQEPIYMFELDKYGSRDISLSPNGLEMVIAFRDKCVRTLIPFQIKKRYSYLFFVLNELKNKEEMPQDIMVYTMVTLLKYFHF
jgi:hypothetical protein